MERFKQTAKRKKRKKRRKKHTKMNTMQIQQQKQKHRNSKRYELSQSEIVGNSLIYLKNQNKKNHKNFIQL